VALDLQIDEADRVSRLARRFRDVLETKRLQPEEDPGVHEAGRMDGKHLHRHLRRCGNAAVRHVAADIRLALPCADPAPLEQANVRADRRTAPAFVEGA